MLEFLVLGPLEARGPAGAVAVGGGKQQLLLAVLVLHAGEVVSRAAIIDALWPEQPPASAAHTVESYVSRLRVALRAAGVNGEIIASAPGGYQLLRTESRVDRDAFMELAAMAGAALERGDARAARDLAREAQGLWRGAALAGIAGEPGVRNDAAALEERRLQVRETRVEAELALGHHAGQIAELRTEASQHPARERVHELLMVALYRAGRQAEALEVYRAAHTHLHGELGLEPGPALRALQARILRHDPTLAAPPQAAAAGQDASPTAVADGRARAVRFGLPAAVAAAAL